MGYLKLAVYYPIRRAPLCVPKLTARSRSSRGPGCPSAPPLPCPNLAKVRSSQPPGEGGTQHLEPYTVPAQEFSAGDFVPARVYC